MRKRIFEYDIVRTIATFSVVFVHISAIAIGLYQPNSMQANMMIFLNRMLKFTTPVFIYLAGALIYESNKKRPFHYQSFLKTRGKRILVPYILISLMYYVLIAIVSKQAFSLTVLMKQIITGSAQYHLYFIPIIIQLYLLTPVLIGLNKKIDRKYLIGAFIVISYISVLTMKFTYSDRIFIKFIVPYALGLYFGSDVMSWISRLGKRLKLLVLSTVAVGIYYTLTFTTVFDIKDYYTLERFRDTGWFFYCILSCFILTLIGMTLIKQERIKKVSGVCSKISYYIYLLHPLFIYLTESMLNRLGILSVTLRFIITLLVVGILSTTVAYLIKGVGWKRYYNMLSKGKKIALLIVAFVLGGSSMVFAYGELVDRGYIPSMKSMTYSNRVKILEEKNEEAIHIYENKKFGYTYNYDEMSVDTSNEAIRTTFFDESTVIDVYYEDLNGTVHSSLPFTIYGNRSIVDSDYVTVKEDTWLKLEGYQVHLLEWTRKPLKYFKTDKTNYASIDVLKNDMEIYNITVNSSNSIDSLSYLARLSIKDIDATATVQRKTYERVENDSWDEATKVYFEKNFIESTELSWGIFEPSTIKGLEPLNEMEASISYDFEYLLQYYNLNSYISDENITAIYDQGKVLEFTLQTSVYGENNPDVILEVLNGVYDEEIDLIVNKVSQIEGPVLFRLNNEMNGDWCYYNAFWFQKDTRIYTALWHYIYEKFEAAEASNIIWIFNPNESSFPGFKWNHYSNYFPGKKYVDIIGVTGYNTGDYYNGEIWRPFELIYDEFMPEYETVFKNYPFMITEFGTSTFGGDKEAWLNEMFEVISKYDFKAAVYWNSVDYTPEREKARVYKFDDDPKMMEVFKKHLNIQ